MIYIIISGLFGLANKSKRESAGGVVRRATLIGQL